jgi:hypothetical protein
LDQAGDFMDAVTGALDAITSLSIPNFGDPTVPLQGALSGVESAVNKLGDAAGSLTDLFGGGS